MNESPMLSVCMITYNHEKFIGRAIDGVIAQKVNFRMELVIGEDCSPDNTYAICKEYASRYPGIIRLLPAEKNMGSIPNFMRTITACTGKYIALSDGDDYWTDPNRLQRDVDFLETHPDYALCFSGVRVEDEIGLDSAQDHFYPELPRQDFTIEDLILSVKNFIPTTTTVLRNVFPRPLPGFFREVLSEDTCIQLLTLGHGKAHYFPAKSAVYRNHEGGISKSETNRREGEDRLMKMLINIDKFYDHKYSKAVRARLLDIAKTQLIFGARDKKGFARLEHYFRRFPDYIRYSDKINLKEMLYYHAVIFFPSLIRKRPKPSI